ncbi:MAG: hypothetical protein V1738_03045 [Patescibacteria group bacterium]
MFTLLLVVVATVIMLRLWRRRSGGSSRISQPLWCPRRVSAVLALLGMVLILIGLPFVGLPLVVAAMLVFYLRQR